MSILQLSTGSDVRTANIGARANLARSSVFDRLGAVVPFQKPGVGSSVTEIKRSPVAFPTVPPSSKVLLNRVVDRTLASNVTEDARLGREPLKRSVSLYLFITF